MPAITTCAKCGFHGAHGFNVDIPYMTTYYHGDCHWYAGLGRVFLSYKQAVQAVHGKDKRYDDLWLAYMLNPSPRKKLARLHAKRCTGGGLSTADHSYLRQKGIKVYVDSQGR